MRIIRSIDSLPAGLRFVATLGIFDGMHRGHEEVIGTLVRVAAEEQAEPLVVTFTPHPETVLRGTTPLLVCDAEERMARIAALGVGTTVVQRFDREFAAQSPEEFMARLAEGRELAGFVMSSESAFGRDRQGTIERIRAVATAEGFRLAEVAPLSIGGDRVSSTRIRDALEAGRLAQARTLLGRRYAVIGVVVHGDHRGRELGYPTANLAFDEAVALPPNGIYAVRVAWGRSDPLSPTQRRDGVASLGIRPTFGGGERLLEVHLFDFDGDLYGVRLRVEFVRRQRGERRFSSVPSLVAQMGLDAERARRILEATR